MEGFLFGIGVSIGGLAFITAGSLAMKVPRSAANRKKKRLAVHLAALILINAMVLIMIPERSMLVGLVTGELLTKALTFEFY